MLPHGLWDAIEEPKQHLLSSWWMVINIRGIKAFRSVSLDLLFFFLPILLLLSLETHLSLILSSSPSLSLPLRQTLVCQFLHSNKSTNVIASSEKLLLLYLCHNDLFWPTFSMRFSTRPRFYFFYWCQKTWYSRETLYDCSTSLWAITFLIKQVFLTWVMDSEGGKIMVSHDDVQKPAHRSYPVGKEDYCTCGKQNKRRKEKERQVGYQREAWRQKNWEARKEEGSKDRRAGKWD